MVRGLLLGPLITMIMVSILDTSGCMIGMDLVGGRWVRTSMVKQTMTIRGGRLQCLQMVRGLL